MIGTICCFSSFTVSRSAITIALIVLGAVIAVGAAVYLTVFIRMASKMKKLTKNLPPMRKVPSMISDAMDAAAKQTEANRNAPEETVNARVIGKRTYVSGAKYTHTRYFAAFELENGERIELLLPGREYSLLAEGDRGRLTYKGTNLISFAR